MSDTQNPWVSPEANIEKAPESSAAAGNGVITDTMRRSLGEASPWLRFLGVINFIAIGFMALAGLIIMLAGTAMSSSMGAMGAGASFLMGLFYLVIALVMFFPARFTWNFGTRIRAWKQSGSAYDLEAALENNKSLWKFSGIVMIIYLAMIPLLLVIAVAAGVSSLF